MGFFKSLLGFEDTPEQKEEKDFETLKVDGMKAMNIRKTDYAIACFQRALEIHEDAEVRSCLAKAYLNTGEPLLAKDQLETLVSTQRDNPDEWIAMAHVQFVLKEWSGMEESAGKALTLQEGNAEALFLLATAQKEQNNLIMAVASLTQILCKNPENLSSLRLRAEVFMLMADWVNAEKDIDSYLEIANNQEEVLPPVTSGCCQAPIMEGDDLEDLELMKAEVQANSGRTDKACTLLKSILANNPFCQKGYLDFCQLLLKTQQPEEALQVMNEAVENMPEFAEGFKMRGAVKLVLGDKEGSMEDLKAAIAIAPDTLKSIDGAYNNINDVIEKNQQSINPFGI
jgi:tetratricopeptide (TPR) repeat protein